MTTPSQTHHIYLAGDLRDHILDQGTCWCKPTHDEEDDIWIHNAMDQRELYESGERKPS